MISIYRLLNPITNETFYVGATYSPTERLKQHISNRKNNKTIGRVIENIISDAALPILEVIEIAEDCDVQKRENFWIDFYNLREVCRKSNYSQGVVNRCYATQFIKRKTISIKIEESIINALEYEAILREHTLDKLVKIILTNYINGEKISEMINDDKIAALRYLAKEELNKAKTVKLKRIA